MREPRADATIATALEEAAAELERAGILNARREAMAIWAALAGTRLGDVWLRRDDEAPTAVAEQFQKAVQRRASGIPFAYAVGRTAFRTLDLKLDGRALIPRPETEGLVALVLEWAGRSPVPGNRSPETGNGVVADIGTGCGCIAVALAVEGTFDRVIAVERSGGAAALARENAELVAAPTPVEVREGDLLEPLAGERYRVIVANPPYVTAAEYDALDPAVRHYEPREALVSGTDGLDATRRLLAGAAPLLAPGGALFLEINERRAEAVRALAQGHGWRRIEIHQDLFGRPRYAVAFPREDA